MTANIHLEHPEDLIFDESPNDVLDSVLSTRKASVKWDGAPALVWGNCPSTGKFFVGTKSVFNKRKIKINYNHHDIDRNHTGEVAKILHIAFECLPIPQFGYLQGDFIGFGGVKTFRPNTIEYRFPFEIDHSIIVALHTCYTGAFLDATPRFGIAPNAFPWRNRRMDQCYLIDTSDAYVRSTLSKLDRIVAKTKIHILSKLAKFPSARVTKQYFKTHVNSYIRKGSALPSAAELYNALPHKYKGEANVNLFRIYHIIYDLKTKLLNDIRVSNNVVCYIGDNPTNHEGFVSTETNHIFKIVNRLEFSKANFTLDKNWTNEKV